MRIVSLLASGTEIVVGLGAGECLVGRSHECDNPDWVKNLPACTAPAFDIAMSSRQIDTEVRRRFKAREPLYHVATSLINSLRPDVLIAQEHCEVCAVTPTDVERAGCVVAGQVMALSAGSLQGIYDGIFAIGCALKREREAANLVSVIKDRITAVNSAVKHRRAPSVIALEWTDPPFAMGNWGPELIEAANGRLLLGERAGEHSSVLDWRQVFDADPDWLIIAPCGFDLDRTLREVPLLEALPGWRELRAVRQRQVVLADGNRYFNRSGTTIVQTAEILAEVLHGFRGGYEGKAWLNYAKLGEWEQIRQRHASACAQDRPSYADPVTGYDVFTSNFLGSRGYCCGNRCRHCPYPDEVRTAAPAPT